jgi:hypothetical protein
VGRVAGAEEVGGERATPRGAIDMTMSIKPEGEILNEVRHFHLQFEEGESPSPELWERFQAWLKADPRHARAYLARVFDAVCTARPENRT